MIDRCAWIVGISILATSLSAQAAKPALLIAAREADARRALYAPKGLHIGGLRLDAGVSQSVAWDNNPTASTGARPGDPWAESGLWTGKTTVIARVVNGPARWRYGLSGDATMVTAPADEAFSYGAGGVRASLSGLSWDRSSLETGIGYRRSVETPGDPDYMGAAAEPTRKDSYVVDGEAALRFGQWLVGGSTAVRWLDYHDTRLRDGRPLEEDDRDRVELDSSMRLGYSVSRTADAFIEQTVSWSIPTRDSGLGFAHGHAASRTRVGVMVDFSDRLVGEASVGMLTATWADARAPAFSGPDAFVELAFAATPLTILRSQAKRMIEDRGELGYVGIVADHISLGVEHELLRNLLIKAEGGYERRRWLGVTVGRHSQCQRLAASAQWRYNARWYLRVGAQARTRRGSPAALDFDRMTVALTVGARL